MGGISQGRPEEPAPARNSCSKTQSSGEQLDGKAAKKSQKKEMILASERNQNQYRTKTIKLKSKRQKGRSSPSISLKKIDSIFKIANKRVFVALRRQRGGRQEGGSSPSFKRGL